MHCVAENLSHTLQKHLNLFHLRKVHGWFFKYCWGTGDTRNLNRTRLNSAPAVPYYNFIDYYCLPI